MGCRVSSPYNVKHRVPVVSGRVHGVPPAAAPSSTCLLLALLSQFRWWLTTNRAPLRVDIGFLLWVRHCARFHISISPLNLCTKLLCIHWISIPIQWTRKQDRGGNIAFLYAVSWNDISPLSPCLCVCLSTHTHTNTLWYIQTVHSNPTVSWIKVTMMYL